MMNVNNLSSKEFLILGLLLALLLPGCQAQPAVLKPLPSPVIRRETQVPVPSSTPAPPTVALLPSATATAALPPSPTATPDPYAALRIDSLAQRSYGGGEITVHEMLADNSYFTRLLISYPSDGLEIYGFLNVPKRGDPPYPVVIALHGYIDPEIYSTVDYTTRYADGLARAGFLVLHPNLRGYPPSDSGDNLFRVGMAVDVLNLIALVKAHGGQPGPLELANPQAIGLWGHSMGGGISTRVITVSSDVDAAVLYAPMSGDERQNYEAINQWDHQRGLEELEVPVDELASISPVYYFDRIQAAISIHHGRTDELVPLRWSIATCEQLQALQKEVDCTWYKNEPHTFYGEGDGLFEQRVIEFFNRELRGGAR
jgi:dipeptidyl aminopeptidase/acylaminoacyl peptidase